MPRIVLIPAAPQLHLVRERKPSKDSKKAPIRPEQAKLDAKSSLELDEQQSAEKVPPQTAASKPHPKSQPERSTPQEIQNSAPDAQLRLPSPPGRPDPATLQPASVGRTMKTSSEPLPKTKQPAGKPAALPEEKSKWRPKTNAVAMEEAQREAQALLKPSDTKEKGKGKSNKHVGGFYSDRPLEVGESESKPLTGKTSQETRRETKADSEKRTSYRAEQLIDEDEVQRPDKIQAPQDARESPKTAPLA